MTRRLRPRARPNELKTTRYQRARRRTAAASLASAAVALTIVACTPMAGWLSRMAAAGAAGFAGAPSGFLALVLFVLAVVLFCELATLPAAIYQALRVDRTYGRRALTVEEVLGGQAQGLVIAAAGALVAGLLVWTAMWTAGRWWWVLAGAWLAVALVVALQGAPALVVRLGGARPLGRPELSRRLDALARQARVPVAGIDQWEAGAEEAASAFVTGVGRGRRVLVSSELAREWTDDEVAVVVAHELAHHAHGDLWWTLGLHAAVLWGSLWMADVLTRAAGRPIAGSGPAALESLPLIALVAGAVWLAAAPLRHAQSRSQERRADAFALRLTGGADAFGAAIRRLGARHLAEERPSLVTRWLYHRHPSVAERLALAQQFGEMRRER